MTEIQTASENAGNTTSPGTVSIVVIENSPHDRRLIREALELWTRPYDLICYDDGHSAIESLKRTRQDLNASVLVLLDWNLPLMHGSKVLKQLREEPNLRGCFIVVFTSSSSDVDRNLARSLGADQFMTKAVDLDDFFYSVVSLQCLV